MASLIYNNHYMDLYKGNIDTDVDSFKAMLVTSGYTPNKDTHDRRDDVTAFEVPATGGYTTGGVAATVGPTLDAANDRVDLSCGAVSWASSTITARGLVYYKSTGTAANDPLVAFIDFGTDIISSAGTFAVTASTLRLSNP